MNIDELALKLAGIHTERTMFAVTDQEICNFARALIAEYEAAGSEPVAWICWLEGDTEQKPSDGALTTYEPKAYSNRLPLYARPDSRVSELEAQNAILQEQLKNKRPYNGRFMSVQDHDEQVAALLVAIDKAAKHVRPTCAELYDELTNISTELLEQRDRKRDAKLIHELSEKVESGSNRDGLLEMAGKRESGEWQPELGD